MPNTVAVQDHLSDPSLHKLVDGMQTLPSLPTLYRELVDVLNSDDTTIDRIAQIIAKDIAMVTKVLQVINSPFYGLRARVSNPTQAVALLGLNTIKSLTLSTKVFAQFDQARLPFFSLDVLWQHGLTTANHARAIAKEERAEQALMEDCFTAGMLHDVGTLVLASNLPDQYTEMLAIMQDRGVTEWDAEQEIYGATHAEVGGFLLSKWGLSERIVEAVAFHHSPQRGARPEFSALAAVHVANAMEEEAQAVALGIPAVGPDLDYLAACEMTDRLPLWQALCRDETVGYH